MNDLQCWKCGEMLADVGLPLRRLEECGACNADLHVCRMCTFYDPSVASSCREPTADEVSDKERSNFCGYFQPMPRAYHPRDESQAATSRSKLEALFGVESSPGRTSSSDADAARERLNDLFGSKPGERKE